MSTNARVIKTQPEEDQKPLNKERTTSLKEEAKDEDSVKDHKKPQILPIGEAPDWHVNSHHIVHGYRVNHETNRALIKSVFQVHNETTNIWTHLAGSIVFLCLFVYTFRYFDPLRTEYQKFVSILDKVEWKQFSGALHYSKILDLVKNISTPSKSEGVSKVKGYEMYQSIVKTWESKKHLLSNVNNSGFKGAIASFMSNFPAIFGVENKAKEINSEDLEAFTAIFKAVNISRIFLILINRLTSRR